MSRRIVVIGHGSRIAQANQEFEKLVRRFQETLAEERISWGYIELAKPLLGEALEEVARDSEEVIVLPVFLIAAGHVKEDIPQAVAQAREKYPNVSFHIARPIGVDPRMIELVAKRLRQAQSSLNAQLSSRIHTTPPSPLMGEGEKPRRAQSHAGATSLCGGPAPFRGMGGGDTVTVIIGRGTSDGEAREEFYRLVKLLEETTEFKKTVPCFIAVSHPLFDETLEQVALTKPKAILIQPYLLFPGRLIRDIERKVQQFSKRFPDIATAVAAPLGDDPLLFEVLKERIERCAPISSPL